MRLDDKRGMTLGDIYPAVLTIVLIGIILGIGIYILAEVEDNVYDTGTSVTVTNESVAGSTSINATAYELGAGVPQALRDASTYVITGAFNYTEHTAIVVTGNITVNATGWVTNASVLSWDNASISYTYTWSADNEATDAMNETIAGLGDFASWIAIIVVVIAAAIVLGIVLSSFGRKTPGV